jgi:RNA polymerase sigma-70 factor (ECF subfamily)
MNKEQKQAQTQRLAAFETVVSEYEAALLRYAGRILYNDNAAQDVVQNAFIRLFKSWKDDMIPSPKLSSWLYRVTHNCAIDYLRKESRRNLLHTKHADEQAKFAAPNRGKGFRISEAAEGAVAALKTLKLREQQLVVLKVYEEKSYKEISEITGLTVSNVGYILHHAMKKMATELKKAKAI